MRLKHNTALITGGSSIELATARPFAAEGVVRSGRLFLLEMSGDRIHSMNPDGFDRKTIVTGCHLPGRHRRRCEGWPRLLDQHGRAQSRRRLDRARRSRRRQSERDRPTGRYVTHSPKQIHLDKDNGKLYWCDREGMRVMRANLDGSQVETLVETGRGDKDQRDPTRWCVGITTDPKLQKIYWTQKGPNNGGQGRILRANIEIPKGASPTNRSDIEVLFDQLPEPIDLELDLANRVLYWTDRGDPPHGNTVNRAAIDKKAGPEILITHLMEGIGIALDVPGSRMFVTDLAGSVYSADLDGQNERNFLARQGNLTGVAYAEI
jgi:hypothetical protein